MQVLKLTLIKLMWNQLRKMHVSSLKIFLNRPAIPQHEAKAAYWQARLFRDMVKIMN
jgi:hypothetical protein